MVWLLRGCYCVLTLVLVCVGAMDTCGPQVKGWAGVLWLVGFQKRVKDLVGEDS